ncbi:putative ribonuclease H-like domain-containing protein, partial [Tanacetum coccineum]
KTKVECYNYHKIGHFSRECRIKGTQDNRRRDAWNSGNKDGSRNGKKEESKALVTVDGEGVDWTNHSEEDEDYALMACNGSDSDTEIDLDDKTDVLTYHKKLLAEAQKEKDDLKAKVEKWHNSSKNLGKLLNSQMSAYDKFGLGYGDHRYNGILSYENEVLQSVFKGKESDFDNPPLNDKSVKTGEMHAVAPPMTGNYMPSGPDIEIDYSQFTYGPKQTQPSESESQTSEFDTCESNISTEPSELVSEPVVNESNVECQPKVWSDAPIIEEYESDSEDEYVSIPTKEHETPSFANQQVKTPRENIKNQSTHSQTPKVNKKELGYGFTVRACFVCGSLNHLIRDCDFHEKRMARKAELNNGWNNVQRVNKQNQFVHSAVLTRTGKIPVSTTQTSGTKNFSTARQSFNRQTVLTCAVKDVDTVKPTVNIVRPAKVFHKTHSPFLRPFKKTTVLRTDFSKQKVNTAKVNAVSTVGRKRETAVKPSAGDSEKEDEYAQDNFVLPIWSSYSSTIKRSTAKDAGKAPNKHPDLKTDEKPVDKEDQVFLDELKKLKRQEQVANNVAEALRKEFAQETEDLLLQAGAAKTSSTNIVNTVNTLVSTASPHGGIFTNPYQDDSEIPALEEIYDNPTDGIFTNSSYDDEGAVAEFTNIEHVVNVSPIPTSRINSIHPSTLILGDPQSAVQTRSKVTKSFGAHTFVSYIQKQRRNNHKDFRAIVYLLGRTAAIQDSKSLDSCRFALWEEGYWNKMGLQEELLQFKILKVSMIFVSLCIHSKDWHERILEAQMDAKGSGIQTGRKSAKAEPSVLDSLFDELPKLQLDFMVTDDVLKLWWRTRSSDEEKENCDDEVSTEDVLSTCYTKVSTDKESTVDQTKGRRATPTTPTTTPTIFGDDETIAQYDRDLLQAVIEADRLLALRLQDEEREQFTVEEREKFLHDSYCNQN